MSFDGKEFGQEIVRVVKGYVERKIAPLEAEIQRLQARIEGAETKRLQARIDELEGKRRVRVQAGSERT